MKEGTVGSKDTDLVDELIGRRTEERRPYEELVFTNDVDEEKAPVTHVVVVVFGGKML